VLACVHAHKRRGLFYASNQRNLKSFQKALIFCGKKLALQKNGAADDCIIFNVLAQYESASLGLNLGKLLK